MPKVVVPSRSARRTGGLSNSRLVHKITVKSWRELRTEQITGIRPMKFLVVCFTLLVCCFSAGFIRAEEKPVPAPALEALKVLVDRQRELLAEAAEKSTQAEGEDLRARFQELVFSYEDYLGKYPDVAAGYVSYALLLNQPVIEQRKRAAALLLKANKLDANLPIVKNQLGNYLAEEGKPLDALNYYLAAVKLAPEEPLYHYQVGTLLTEAREDFLKSGAWTRATLDQAMQDAFEEASALAPGNTAYAYRYGESYYDLERPEWSAAFTFWRSFEEKMTAPLEKETARLHQANVLIHQEKFAGAREVLATIAEPALQAQKQKLVAQLEAKSAK
jgi:tetratricopeptide (TPR) repeat protein